ncbi:MAG: hypothetical protein ABFD49_10010 [Armatimonadota bacterium]|nr:carboxypeptidase-like regulatory domain-containing protein [bacterium]
MSRFFTLILILGVVAALALTGCGGGGGGSSSSSNSGGDGSRTITGKVVSSETGSGISGVLVTLGSGFAADTTDSTGKFEFELTATKADEIPAYIQVDASNASDDFSSDPVTYGGQTFNYDNITVPVEIRNGESDSFGTFTLAYVGGEDPPPVPIVSHDTVLTGRIIRSDTSVGIPLVTVTFGTKEVTTGAYGYFEIDLGLDEAVPDSYTSLSIDTSGAGSAYPTTLSVSYNGSQYDQDAIAVPEEIYGEDESVTDFGDITVMMSSSGGSDDDDDDDPPIPPSL